MENKEQIVQYISEKLSRSKDWVFISNECIDDKMQTCVLSPDRMQVLYSVMHWLRSEPELWDALKKIMDEQQHGQDQRL